MSDEFNGQRHHLITNRIKGEIDLLEIELDDARDSEEYKAIIFQTTNYLQDLIEKLRRLA